MKTKTALLNLIFIACTIIPSLLYAQKNKKKKETQEAILNVKEPNEIKQENFDYLGILVTAPQGLENKFYYEQPQLMSLIGCPDCEIKAHTIFETDPDKIVYLDTIQMRVERSISGNFYLNGCNLESSFFAKQGALITLFIGWAPIAPITFEFYRNGVKLPVTREFEMSY